MQMPQNRHLHFVLLIYRKPTTVSQGQSCGLHLRLSLIYRLILLLLLGICTLRVGVYFVSPQLPVTSLIS